MDLAIVIPVFNEAGNITSLIDEIAVSLEGLSGYEIIVVDDGSTDATASGLAACNGRYPQLRVVRHRVRYGQTAAIATGVEAAAAERVVTMDGDGQSDPADILRLYQALRDAPDEVWLVNGYRRQRADSAMKRASSRIANAARAFVLGDGTPDTGCGLKAFARETFIRLPRFDHMHRFLPALVQRQGGRVVSIEVNHRARQGGQSKYGVHNRLWAGLVDMLGVWWLQRRKLHPVIDKEEP